MYTHDHDLIITDTDLERLHPVFEQNNTPAADALEREISRARIVPQRSVPPDVVTMNSEVTYEDCATGVRRTVRVVYPHKADAASGHVSVLAPIGSALLGLRAGQTIEWEVPNGRKRVQVIEVRYQPEASGHFDR